MSPAIDRTLNVESTEGAILAELLEIERERLLVGIRHTHHRVFRDELRRRLGIVEGLAARCPSASGKGSDKADPTV